MYAVSDEWTSSYVFDKESCAKLIIGTNHFEVDSCLRNPYHSLIAFDVGLPAFVLDADVESIDFDNKTFIGILCSFVILKRTAFC